MSSSFYKYVGGYGLIGTGAKVTIKCHPAEKPKLWTIKIEKNGEILETLKATDPGRAYEIFENISAKVVELIKMRKKLGISISDILAGKKPTE